MEHDERTVPESLSRAAGHARVLAFWSGGGTVYWLAPQASATLGRSADCQIRIEHRSVSRVHAVLIGGDPVRICDLGSSNGVRVAGVRIPVGNATAIRSGDVVELGEVLLAIEPPPPPVSTSSTARSDEQAADESDRMAPIERLIELVARSDIPVLLLGETGVGKGLTASEIHRRSGRADKPLMRVDCAALPENLLEAELFGYEQGAFTGATRAKPGLLEAAEGGTLFLDEIAEASLAIQAKLLGCVENREVLRLGSLKSRRVDVRFVAATNRDVEARVQSGAFRQDLFYRLNGVAIRIPPLRQRRKEILPLANRFLDELGTETHPRIGRETAQWLLDHGWPGNIRELRKCMERALTLCEGDEIAIEHIAPGHDASEAFDDAPTPARPQLMAPTGLPQAARGTLRDELLALERRRIEEALNRCEGNQTRAAKELGMSRRALIARIESYGLPRPNKRE